MKDKFTLEEIASWCNTQNSEIEIPPLQRGLVWKPKQVELLWDSILRGFPIGSFMLSEGDKQTKSYSLHSARTWETTENASACVGLRNRPHRLMQPLASAHAAACVFKRVPLCIKCKYTRKN